MQNARPSKSKPPRRAHEPDDGATASADYLRAWMRQGLHDLSHDSILLAVGCEQAFLAPQLAEYAADVTVLDTCAAQLAQLSRRFPEISFLRHEPSSPLPFPHGTFDAIWCGELLDRVFDPAAALRELHRVLAPGGRLLLTVPDHSAVRNVLIALFRWDEHFAPTSPRIRHFTRGTLVKLARDAGFIDIATARAGTVRRVAGELVPRSLLLAARRGPAVPSLRPSALPGENQTDVGLAGELAYASHGPGAGR
ncbi:MAG: methyltransferase domain-containing protein [Opitutaceae bacterium]|nr:methyltransferase domain-containing protein [Opitutaceae bacterium]